MWRAGIRYNWMYLGDTGDYLRLAWIMMNCSTGKSVSKS